MENIIKDNGHSSLPPEDNPVIFCMNCLNTGSKKEEALEKAKIAAKLWMIIDMRDKHPTNEEATSIMKQRSFVFSIVACTYLWNHLFKESFEIEDEFLFYDKDDQPAMRKIVEPYLMMLIIQKQEQHLEEIFEDMQLRNDYLSIHDAFISLLKDPNYYFKSKNSDFVPAINKINAWSRIITGDVVG